MERRLLLAVALSFLVISLYGSMTGQCSPRPPQPPAEPGTPPGGPGATPEQPGTTPRPTGPGAPAEAPPSPTGETWLDETPEDAAPLPEQTVLSSEELEVGFTNQGGAVAFVRLQQAKEADKETPLDLVVPADDALLFGQIDRTWLKPRDGAPGGSGRAEDPAGLLRTALWQRDVAAEAATAELDVVYRLTTDQAVWTKRWILATGEGRYDVRLRLSRRVRTGVTAEAVRVKVLASGGLLREGETGAAYQYPNAAVVRLARDSDVVLAPFGIPVQDGTEVRDLRLLGTRSHYFLSTFYVEKDRAGAPQVVRFWATGEESGRRAAMERRILAYFQDVRGRTPEDDPALLDRVERGVQDMLSAWLVVEVPTSGDAAGEEEAAIELPFYVGPIDRHTLRAEEYTAVKPVISYQAAFDVIADALLGIYDVFRSLLGNAGIAVILMTLVVRGLMMPLSIKNQLSMRQYSRKIAKLKPNLEVLKKKYANNPKRLREEQAKLYREHGVGFPMGCLLMLVQVPIFFALFSSLRAEYTLRNSAFLWIADMGAPDKLIDFGGTILDLGILQIFSLNVLPLLMVGLSLWQQRLMPKPADEQAAQQMRMMKWLPIIFAVILYNYTAALALYMALSSVVSIVESRVVRARDDDEGAEGMGSAARA